MNLGKMSPTYFFVRALYDFVSKDSSSLSFKKDDIIQVLTQLESGWWDGLCNGERGWFPSNYVSKEVVMLDDDQWISQQTPDGEIFYFNMKTGESTWELPMDGNEYTTRDTITQLPGNWIQKPTKDDNTFNEITKEISGWTYPGGFTSTDISSDEELDSQVIALVETGLEGVDTADEANIASLKDSQLSTASVDTIQQRGLQQRQDQLIRTDDNRKRRSDDKAPNEPLPPTPITAMTHPPERLSQPLIHMLQNENENLTWDSLSQYVDLSIRNLNSAVQGNMKQDYANCTKDIVDSVRIMLYASGTVEKDSVAIRQNKNLKNYHRNIMASLSKLILSTKAAATNIWPPQEVVLKIKSDADEILDSVHKFIQIAQKSIVIKRVDPKIIESATGGSWHGNNLMPTPTSISYINSEDNSTFPSYPLTPDLIDSLDKISHNVTQSIVLLLNYVRKVIDTSNSSMPGSFSPLLISQTKQVLTQVGQFLSIVEDVNLKDLDESSFDTTINEFKISKQTLYNNMAGLVICVQTATDPLSSLNAMDQVLDCANVVEKSVKDVIITIKSLVDGKIQGMRSSAVENFETAENQPITPTSDTTNPMRSRRPSAVENFETAENQPITPTSDTTNPMRSRRPSAVENFEPAENQPITPSSDTTNPSVPKSLETVPENGIMTNNGGSIIISNEFNLNNDDVPVSPVSTSAASGTSGHSFTSTSRLHRSYTQSSATSTAISSAISSATSSANSADYSSSYGSNTAKLRSKVTKFFGEDVSSNATQPQKQKDDKPLFLNYDYEPSEMVFNMEGSVKGGTLNALAERLTMHDLLDSNFIATFLLTYRSFCSTIEFFDLLVKRFMIQPPESLTREELEVWQEKKQTPVRLRVFNIIKTWLELYYIDGEDVHCLERMREFARTTMHENMAFAAVSLTKVIEKRQQQRKDAKFKELIATNASPPPAPILPKNIKKLRFLDIDPLEIARQLTLIECKLYNKIQPVECLDKAWSQDEGDGVAINIKAMIVNSNKITGWVAESVLNQKEARKRCLYIKHFVAVAEKCRCLNNFNSLTAITSGLYSAPIHRLKRTWEMINTRTTQTLENLCRIMNSTRNFAEYREMLHSINPPCVPFFGLYLTDLTFIEDGNPNFLKNSDKLINFSKRMKTAEVIREIQQYQSVPYNLISVPEIQMFVQCHLQESRDVKDLYDLSLTLEPREREDEKIARLLQESGFL